VGTGLPPAKSGPVVSYELLRGLYQVCSNNLKQSSLNLHSSALRIDSATNSLCYCAERIYNKILKDQVSASVEIMLFTMFEFNWQKNESIVRAAAIMTHFWAHAVQNSHLFTNVTVKLNL